MAKNKKKKNNSQKIKSAELQNQTATEEVEAVEAIQAEVKAEQPAPKTEKADKKQKDNKKADKKAKPTAKERGQGKIKETVAELKKVTWPTFPKVVKNTLLVLGIVLLSTIVLFGIDFGLSQLYKLLTPAA